MSARVLVFGGSGALGRVVCATLAQEDARVAFTYYRREDLVPELMRVLPGGLARRLDMRDVAAVEHVVDDVAAEMGGIDAWIQCAGVAVTMEAADPRSHHLMSAVDVGGWEEMMNVNVRSTFFAVRRVSAVMRRGGGGNVVLVGSIDGVKPVPSPVHYAASKGALGGMTTAMAKELGPDGIRVNMVAPGILESGIARDIPPNLLQEYLKHCGLRRVGRQGEIAAIVAWLALHNTYVTGQTILADGAL
jgi:NAD(P)-dependent dehydrogenase (short-subunit alcohol dehydrogenase family)